MHPTVLMSSCRCRSRTKRKVNLWPESEKEEKELDFADVKGIQPHMLDNFASGLVCKQMHMVRQPLY